MTPKEIRETFEYDPETGDLRWKVKRWRANIGDIAGTISKRKDTSYRVITLGQKKLYAHRLVWILHKGSIRNGLIIDHDDGNGLNNRISNLKATTHEKNQRNRRRTNNGGTSGIAGVYRHRGGFSIHICSAYLGWSADFFEACCMRKSAEAALGFKFNGQPS